MPELHLGVFDPYIPPHRFRHDNSLCQKLFAHDMTFWFQFILYLIYRNECLVIPPLGPDKLHPRLGQLRLPAAAGDNRIILEHLP